MVIPVLEVAVLNDRQDEHLLAFHLPGTMSSLRVEGLPIAGRAQPGPGKPDLADVPRIRVLGIVERRRRLQLRRRSKRVPRLLIVPDELRGAEMDAVAI